MPAQTEIQSAQDATTTRTVTRKTNHEPSTKRRRVHSQDTNAVHESRESTSSDDEAYTRALELTAIRGANDVKRLRRLEGEMKRIDAKQSGLERRHEEHEDAVQGLQATTETSISRLAEELKNLPTSTDMEKLVGIEREARKITLKDALDNFAGEVPDMVTKIVNSSLDDFAETVMKTALVTVTNRVDAVDSKMHRQFDLKDIDTRVVEKVKRSVTEMKGQLSVMITTQLDTRLGKYTSDLEATIIPQALARLTTKVDKVSDICGFTELKLLDVIQQQEKHASDCERQCKELAKASRDMQASSTKATDQLVKEIQALRKTVQAQHQRNTDIVTSMARIHAAQQEDKDSFQQMFHHLTSELRAEREGRKSADANNETILRRLGNIEQSLHEAKQAQSILEADWKHVGAQTAAKLLAQERSFRTQLQELGKAAKTDITELERDFLSKIEQQKADTAGHLETSIVDDLRNRMEKLETVLPQEPTGHTSEVTVLKKDFATLKKTVVDLATATARVSKHADSVPPMMTDITLLQDQYQGHIAICRQHIQEQARNARANLAEVERKLKARIQDQELALRDHLFGVHNITEKPVSLQRRARLHTLQTSTRERQKQRALAQQMRMNTTRIEQVSSGLQAMDTKINYLTSCVAEDMQDVEVKVKDVDSQGKSLAEKQDELQAEQDKLRIRVINVEASDRKRSRRRESSHLP